jgi:uncharacterized damage-inducible protein DinB
MIGLGTIRECFRYNDWARDRLLGLATGLTDTQLDRPFEMGEGSLRATVYHLWAAEFGWLNRWQPQTSVSYDAECVGEPATEIARRFRETTAARDAFLARLDDASLSGTITFRNKKGIMSTFNFGDMMLHVCNHGTHHRAQALNMLRHLGVETPKPGIDYVLWRLQEPPDPPPALDIGSLRAYYAYADWARNQVHATAVKLGDEQLDRPFEIGSGSLRATLIHIQQAEQWWWQNWTLGPGQPFPAAAARLSIAELTRLFDTTAAQRDDFLNRITDGELPRPVSAMPRPGVTRTFPLGVTMLQLCHHGTHHRAQALNMLRHVGGEVPALDYVAMLRQRAAPVRK